MRNLVLAAAALAVVAPTTASASFIVSFPGGSLQTIPGPGFPNNDFQADFASLGLTAFASAGASIALSAADTVIFEYMGSESGVANTFSATGIGAFAETNANHFASGDNTPTFIGSAAFAAGAFSADFFASGIGSAISVGNGQFGIVVPTVNTTSTYVSDVLYFIFDDNVSPTSDNHDDHIIRVRVQSAVPEPTTWAMMLSGFGIVGAMMRRRKITTRVSFA
ncbi:MAG: PEPxxWA-CTERM sorting domain-containing protein [Sphingomonadaceae bacterium]